MQPEYTMPDGVFTFWSAPTEFEPRSDGRKRYIFRVPLGALFSDWAPVVVGLGKSGPCHPATEEEIRLWIGENPKLPAILSRVA